MRYFERTFNSAATEYDRIRPMYVKELFDDIFKYKSINSDCNVLEIGMGTGKATKPILDTQCRFVGIEPGELLVALAKEKLKKYSNFSIHNLTVQEYACPERTFDLIYAATSFHWIPEDSGYKRVYALLKNGGVFARFAYHAGTDNGRPELTEEIRECYNKYMNTASEPKEYCENDARMLAELAAKYGFADTEYKLYYLTKNFNADEYIELLKTYPDHMAIDETNRKKLFSGIHSAINNNGGIITVYYTMDLELARKL